MKQMPLKIMLPIAIVAVILILIGNTSLWFNRTIFNRQNFANLAVTAIQTEESRNAIASEIVDEALKNTPVIKNIAGNTIESAISGLLDSDFVKPVISSVAKIINFILTSKRPQEISIDISTVKGFVQPFIQALNKQFNLDIKNIKLPDNLILAEPGQIPSLYSVGVVLLWLGPFSWLLGIGLLVAMVWIANPDRRKAILKTIGLTLAIGSLIIIFLVPMLKSAFLASITNENFLIIAGSIYSVFTGVLIKQTLWLLVIGVLIILSGYYLDSLLELPSRIKRRRAT